MFATQVIPPLIQQGLTVTVYGEQPTSAPTPIQVGSPSLIEAGRFTQFDYMAPGIFAFASIFLTMMVAQSFTEDREKGLLRRLNVTPTSPAEVMTSHALSNMLAALMQVALVFGMAFLIGFFVTFETKDVVIAGFLGPFLFLFFNYFIILGILFINPAYTTTLIPGWQWIWGMNPNWAAVFNEVLVSFTLLYLQSLFLFLVMATPFILVLSFTGNAFRQMMGWSI